MSEQKEKSAIINFSKELYCLKRLHEKNIEKELTDKQFNEIFEVALKYAPGLFHYATKFETSLLALMLILGEATMEWETELREKGGE